MREIVTLQFGQQANYVGTHFWNTQEAYFTYAGQEESPVDHDVSFRAGIGADGTDTFTPRTVIYDLKGGFGTLRRENALYQLQQQQDPSRNGQWTGNTIPLHLPPITPSPYQQALDQGQQPPALTTDTVRFWSDYNHLFYHPRSIVQLNEYELNSSLLPFEKWATGEELFANLDREHDLLDRDLRPFLEECDRLQGLQILTGVDDAWGGFCSRYLERISDDLGKGCRWVFGLKDGQQVSRERQMLQLANMAQSVSALNHSASLHIPLNSSPRNLPPYVSFDGRSPWHTSALEAVIMESITLPTRLRGSDAASASFDTLETTLNNEGNRRLAAAAFSVEDPDRLLEKAGANERGDARMTNGLAHEDEIDERPSLDIDVFPQMRLTSAADGRRLGRRTHIFTCIESLRGHWTPDNEQGNPEMNGRSSLFDGPRLSTHHTDLLFPVLPSYPSIFHFNAQSESLAIRTELATSTRVADQVKDLEGSVRRLVGVEEREALCDGLVSLAEEYEEGWSGSDGSDDE